MYDFCFTIPYGVLLVFGGLLGFLLHGSIPSLVAGTLSGIVMTGLGYVSYQHYQQGKLCKPATAAALIISLALSLIMHKRFQVTGTIFPAFFFTMLSGLMFVFYIWSLLCGPLPKRRRS